MRALVLFPQTFGPGGIQRFNRTFLAACERTGIGCDVLSLNDADLHVTDWRPAESTTIRVFDRNKPRFAAAVMRAIWRAEHHAVVIGHVNLVEMATWILTLRCARRPRSLLITHGVDVWTGIRGMRRQALSSVDRILSVSDYTRRSIQEQAPELTDERVIVFPNALSEFWVAHQESLRAQAPQASWPERFILSVARLDQHDRRKGIVTVIESLAMLADRQLHYVIAGSGDDMDFLRTIAQRCGVADRVHFLGSVSDHALVGLYRQCEAFVLPSGQEGFGIVFLEAMYFGAPVIAAREKGAIDVVQDGETGLLVGYGDTIGLAAAIERLLGDDALRSRLREAARATVVDDGRFTFRAFAERCGSVLRADVTCHRTVVHDG